MIQTKSAYDPRHADDGYRILIEPEWPKGMPKGKSAGCDWMKSLYPSQNLRGWMRRNPRKYDGFRNRYLLELAHNEAATEKICKLLKQYPTITVLTVPSDEAWDIHDTLVSFLRARCE